MTCSKSDIAARAAIRIAEREARERVVRNAELSVLRATNKDMLEALESAEPHLTDYLASHAMPPVSRSVGKSLRIVLAAIAKAKGAA